MFSFTHPLYLWSAGSPSDSSPLSVAILLTHSQMVLGWFCVGAVCGKPNDCVTFLGFGAYQPSRREITCQSWCHSGNGCVRRLDFFGHLFLFLTQRIEVTKRTESQILNNFFFLPLGKRSQPPRSLQEVCVCVCVTQVFQLFHYFSLALSQWGL